MKMILVFEIFLFKQLKMKFSLGYITGINRKIKIHRINKLMKKKWQILKPRNFNHLK